MLFLGLDEKNPDGKRVGLILKTRAIISQNPLDLDVDARNRKFMQSTADAVHVNEAKKNI